MSVHKKNIFTVTLNPAWDTMLYVDNFQIGKDHKYEQILKSAGGKGLNVARVLERLKSLYPRRIGNILATGFLGKESYRQISGLLSKENIQSKFAVINEPTRVNYTIVGSESEKQTRIFGISPRITSKELQSFNDLYCSFLKKHQCVIFSGSNIGGISDVIYSELINQARKSGVLTVVDTSGEPLAQSLKAKPDVIKPNLKEAEQIFGKKLDSQKKICEGVKWFHDQGIKTVIISLGAKGAVGSNGKEMYLAVCPKIKIIQNVGCGDAFLAGFIFNYLMRQNLKESLQLGAASGAANGLSMLPGAIDSHIVKKILKTVQFKNL